MRGVNNSAMRLGLDALAFSGLPKLLERFAGGIGVMLTLHHVLPSRSSAFQPNRALEISAEFFEQTVEQLVQMPVDIVSIDEVRRRLVEQDTSSRRFVCLTFDDGYRDLVDIAYPILKR